MSTSEQEEQKQNTLDIFPTMDLLVEDPSTKTEEKESNVGLLVHTKHSCDKCYKEPIIGKRYKSDVKPNFDLCASCFDAYTGPDIGLSEEVLARDKKKSCEFVLKLKIDNGGSEQTRRIKVSEVWDESIAQLSYDKMMSIAYGFAFPDATKVDNAKQQVKTTYVDDDGDTITFTSNKELGEAFEQVLKKLPVHKPFVITVTIPRNEPVKVKEAPGMPKRIQLRKMEPSKKVFAVSMDKYPANPKATPLSEKDFFVHARHTCDGCSKSPIIGTRYHATKIKDFDLCGKCFEAYEGDKADFEPDIQDRDRRMQRRWLKKGQFSGSTDTSPSSNVAGMWHSANGDLAGFLKKVQEESGGVIESATVYAGPPCEGFKGRRGQRCKGGRRVAQFFPGGFEVHTSPPCKGFSPSNQENSKKESAANGTTAPATGDSLKEGQESAPKVQVSIAEKSPEPESPVPGKDESFLEDAEGSIAEAIGRTLDVCVAAIEDAMEDVEKANAGVNGEKGVSKNSGDDAVDAFSVASSMVSNMTDILKKMDESKKVDSSSQTVVSQSDDKDGIVVEKEQSIELPKVEDVLSDGEDEWSVVEDDDKASVSSVLSPVVLAKWDTELKQMHELGFLDDRKNVDALEHLEASHLCVDSTEKVTVNAAVEYLLK